MTRDFPEYRNQIKALMAQLRQEMPDTMKGFGALHAASMKGGAIDEKTKELIALGIGIGARCDGCIAFHTHEALAGGATRQEVLETISVAISMGGGPSLMYGLHALEALDQFSDTKGA